MIKRLFRGWRHHPPADAPTPLCVGIRNQGATCYLNSLLQTLFHLTYFRVATYVIPTEEDDVATSIPLALQLLFYHLQCKKEPASTHLLTRSFGWSPEDAFIQQDIHELIRVFCDKLADKMKGTPSDRAIDKIFLGSMMTYINCLDVDFKSTCKEKFYDIQLQVRGCNTVYAALDAYTSPEILDGENKYCVEKDGKQTYSKAKKGIYFQSFPPVIIFHLRRFEMDYETMTYQKINSRFEFPEKLDLNRYIRRGGEELGRVDSIELVRQHSFAAPPDNWKYRLHAVLVHSGSVDGGHYYCYIRPAGGDQWVCFDDEVVTPVRAQEAIEANYGGSSRDGRGASARGNRSSAYVLVYVRKIIKSKVVYPPTDDIRKISFPYFSITAQAPEVYPLGSLAVCIL